MSNATIQNTKVNTVKSFNNKGAQKSYPKKSTSAYENMVVLKRDLYYKSIVNANADRITAGTELAIKDIFWRYRRGHISRPEIFNELEAMKSGYACTDTPVKNAIKQLRAKKTN